MFVSDAHLFVPREIRWSRVLAVRFSALRRRKSLARRLKRDLRAALPVAALVFTFASTMVTAELATLLMPTGAPQSPSAEAVQQSVARFFAPATPPASAPAAEPLVVPAPLARPIGDGVPVVVPSMPSSPLVIDRPLASHRARSASPVAASGARVALLD